MEGIAPADDAGANYRLYKVYRMGTITTRFEYIAGGLNQCGYWRDDWQFRHMDGKGNQMRDIDKIFVHCSATRPNWWAGRSAQEQTAEIKRWHTDERGWSDIGYHFVIGRDGTVVEGRPVERTPAAQRGHNKGSIAICLLGGHGGASDDAFLDNFTEEQDEALRGLVEDLFDKYDIDDEDVFGHNEVSTKACPCFDVQRWLDG